MKSFAATILIDRAAAGGDRGFGPKSYGNAKNDNSSGYSSGHAGAAGHGNLLAANTHTSVNPRIDYKVQPRTRPETISETILKQVPRNKTEYYQDTVIEQGTKIVYD